MKFHSLLLFLTVFLMLSSVSMAQELSIGVSPSRIDLGEVERGSTEIVELYIITPSNGTFLVNLEPSEVYLDASTVNENYSEESIIPWVNIINNPVEIEANEEVIGSSIKGQRKISFLMEIPEDAEPGEHMVNINPVPLPASEAIGSVGSMVRSTVPVRLRLDVKGNSVRDGSILDVMVGRYLADDVEIETYFQNTGTVTISATGSQRIYDKEGNLVKEIKLDKSYIGPKEIMVFRGRVPIELVSSEDYMVHTVFDYMTGKEESDSVLSISLPTGMGIIEGEAFSPLLLFLVVAVVIISIILYRKVR